MMAKPIKNLLLHYFFSNDLVFNNKYQLFVKPTAMIITLVLQWERSTSPVISKPGYLKLSVSSSVNRARVFRRVLAPVNLGNFI